MGREKKAKQKRLRQKKHQALLREHQKIKAQKKKGQVGVKGKKKTLVTLKPKKKTKKKNTKKKGKPQQRKPKKLTKKKKQNNNKNAKKASQKKSLPRKKEKKWHKSLMLRNIHCTCNEFLKNQRAKKLLNKRLLDSVILKKL